VAGDKDAGARVIHPSDVLDLLKQLADKSLVVIERKPGAEAWYHMLETIRQYALAKLALSGEADALRERHAAYYLTAWDRHRPEMHALLPQAWFDRLETELDNLRAALPWSQSPLGNAELGLRLSVAVPSGLVGYTEKRRWYLSALARADAERADYPQARAVALKWLGAMDAALGDYASGRAHLDQSLVLFKALADSTQCAFVLERLGWLAREQGDIATARLQLAQSLALYRELGDKAGTAYTLNTLGEVAVMQGDAAEAAGLLKEALALNRALENTESIGWSLNHLGHVAQLQGEYALAKQLHEETLPLFRERHRNFIGVGEANQALGETALAQSDAPVATRHFRQALELFRFHAARAQMSWCLAGLAGVAVLDEEPQRAARLWGAAEALRQSIGAREAPASGTTRERLMAKAREQLGAAAFDAAWAQGQALTMELAIEQAPNDPFDNNAEGLGPPR
jgi:non-specific serine/threonine protein kinase